MKKFTVILIRLIFVGLGLLVFGDGVAEDLAEKRKQFYQQVERAIQQQDTAKALAQVKFRMRKYF